MAFKRDVGARDRDETETSRPILHPCGSEKQN